MHACHLKSRVVCIINSSTLQTTKAHHRNLGTQKLIQKFTAGCMLPYLKYCAYGLNNDGLMLCVLRSGIIV